MKEGLIHWVSCALKKALIDSNIKKGFSAIGIRSFNLSNMASKMGPSEWFGEGHDDDHASDWLAQGRHIHVEEEY
jgi:hypothetical protein